MKDIQVTATIIVKGDGETMAEVKPIAGVHNDKISAAAGAVYDDTLEMTQDEVEKYAVASDLANVCDYLEDSEVIKIRLIIRKAQARKERREARE